MIDPKSRSREWILESCEKNKVKDPTLMEKTIRAFSLLEALTKSGCPFLYSPAIIPDCINITLNILTHSKT
jgi:hypothetical protein